MATAKPRTAPSERMASFIVKLRRESRLGVVNSAACLDVVQEQTETLRMLMNREARVPGQRCRRVKRSEAKERSSSLKGTDRTACLFRRSEWQDRERPEIESEQEDLRIGKTTIQQSLEINPSTHNLGERARAMILYQSPCPPITGRHHLMMRARIMVESAHALGLWHHGDPLFGV